MKAVGLACPLTSIALWMMFGVHWKRASASALRGELVYRMNTNCPLSPSITPLYFTAGEPSRVGSDAERKSWLPVNVSVKAIPFSSSSTVPAAFTTWKTAFALTALPSVALGSRMVAVRLSEQEYWYLSSRAMLPGRECDELFQLCVCPVVPSTGPETTSANGCPPASRRPSPSVSSPGSSRPLWLVSSSWPSGVPLIAVICPANNPPAPFFTRTFQVPVGIWLPLFGNNRSTKVDRCTASMLLYLSCTGVSVAGRAFDH